ncbi:MAG TPA: hypothetical protein VD789_08965 [Thermomicrobiales bacterium]|nr:hypothetical protein [Thermomicrobiales bacterium]
MVDCFDRIAVQMTEIALEPIQQLAIRPMMLSASVRLPSNGKRVQLTVRKRFLQGENGAPVYAWQLDRLESTGDPVEPLATSPAIRAYPSPEDAFWGAVDALRDINLGQQSAG